MRTICLIIPLTIIGFSSSGQQAVSIDAKTTLAVEKAVGFNVGNEHYLLLDSIFQAMDSLIVFPKKINKTNALKICKDMSALLSERFGFRYYLTELFSECLTKRVLDCNYYSLLFYDFLAKQHYYDVMALITPGHIFIRWYLPDGAYFNYETNMSIEYSDEQYLAEFNISEHALENKIYMTPLTDVQFFSVNYVDMTCALGDSAVQKQQDLCDKAIQLYEKNVNAWIRKGYVYALQKRFNDAIFCYQRVLAMDTLNCPAFLYIGLLYSEQDKSDEAGVWFNKAISCNPKDPQSIVARAEELLKRDDVEGAMADFEVASAMLKQANLYQFLTDYSRLFLLEQKIMEAYLKKKK